MRNIMFFASFFILVACISCKSTRIIERTNTLTEKNVQIRIDTIQKYDSTYVLEYVKDSVHYVFRDHYADGVRKIYVYDTDTVVRVDSVCVAHSYSTGGNTKARIAQIVALVILLIVLCIIVRKL